MVEKKMTRRDLAMAAGVSERTIYNMLLGTTEIRDLTLKPIADALSMAMSDLTHGQANDYPMESSTPMIMRDSIESRDITLSEAVAAIARQTGTDERIVREVVADLVMGNKKQRRRL